MNLFRGRWGWPRGDHWLHAILLLALVLRLYHIAYPPWDYHNWRQTQTLMVARDFARNGFNLLHPQVQWVSNGLAKDPSYFSGEFSIESLLASLLYKVFGEHDFLARLVVIAFSLLGIYFLYGLLNRRAGPFAARIGAFIYALLPYHLFFGRVFMPDVPALSLALGGLFFLDRWTGDRKPVTLLIAAAFTAAAILQKLTVVFVGLPALYLFWLAKGRQLFVRAELYVFAAVASVPSLAWYIHANAMARASGFALMQPGVFGHQLGSWLHADFLHRTLAPLSSEAFAPAGVVLLVLGVLWPARNPAFWIFRLWIAGAGSLLLLIPDLLSANYYYFSLLLPGAAALGGLVLAKLASTDRATYPLVGVILAIFAIEAIGCALPLYQDDRAPRDLGILLNRLTTPSDLIAVETGGSPNVLYFADRRGWMLAQQYDLGLLQRLAKAGALYYADPSTSGIAQRADFFREMDVNFERLTPDQGPWPIYRLSAKSPELPAAKIEHFLHVKLGGEAELLDASLRKLAESPASLELDFLWRCLKESGTDPVIVTVRNTAGEAVYRADYNLSMNSSGPRLKPGEIVRKQRVMVLPASLPEGNYQICIGPDNARVGEVNISQRPHYGWFTAN